VKYYFKDINETASVDRLEGAEKLFRLRYTNHFYGNCSLRFHLRRLSDGQIHVDRSSMQVEASEVKKGDLNSLIAVSLRFLTQKLAQHPEIFDGERVAAQPGWLARFRAWCGLSQPEQNPAVYEKNRSGLRKAGTP
jgi:hypothetical protein